MKKLIALPILVASLALTACGGGSDGSTTDQDSIFNGNGTITLPNPGGSNSNTNKNPDNELVDGLAKSAYDCSNAYPDKMEMHSNEYPFAGISNGCGTYDVTFKVDGSKGKLHFYGSKTPMEAGKHYIAAELYMDEDFGLGLEDEGGYRLLKLEVFTGGSTTLVSKKRISGANFNSYDFLTGDKKTSLSIFCSHSNDFSITEGCTGYVKVNDVQVDFETDVPIEAKSQADFGYTPSN